MTCGWDTGQHRGRLIDMGEQTEEQLDSQVSGQVLVQLTSLSLAWVEILQTPAACLLSLFCSPFCCECCFDATILDLPPLNDHAVSGFSFACFHFHPLSCIECVYLCVCVFCFASDKQLWSGGNNWVFDHENCQWKLIGFIFQGSQNCCHSLKKKGNNNLWQVKSL